MKFYRGSAAAARSYVEADHSRADDYYLAEGSGVAEHYAVTVGVDGVCTERRADLDGASYERWVAGYDVGTGQAKGRLRDDGHALRFIEVVVNGPKTWSLAAALHPDIADAYEDAQTRAAGEIITWVAQHATTRVGPRGRQVQVPVEKIEAALVRHYTSRAGDPHRHLHVQINARVFARGAWRGLHSVGVVDSIEALNGIGRAAVMCDPQFRAALAARGYTLDDAGEINELAPYAGRFSQRAAQIGRNIDRYEAEWRADNPGREPGPKLRRTWDRRAWSDARPEKVAPADGADLVRRWNEELHDLGFRAPIEPSKSPTVSIGQVRRDAVAELILTRLSAKRSSWNAADIRGEAEKVVASIGLVAERPARVELAEDITARAVSTCRNLRDRTDVPDHIRNLTSDHVLDVEADLVDAIATRALQPVAPVAVCGGELDAAQRDVVGALAGRAGVLVIEGAAGTGKTTTLAAAHRALELQDRRLVVVTPTLKAAQAAQQQVGADALSAAKLIHQHGFRWDEDGHWSRVDPAPDARARLLPGDVLLVDEAGMHDQDTARALLAIADRAGATVALLGDRYQLPAVGRGGVLDLAARWSPPEAHLKLESVHRFSDETYADLSLLMRIGERPAAVFDALLERGQVVVHASDVERTAAVADIGARGDELIIADTRGQVADINAAIRDRRQPGSHHVGEAITRRGERIGLGDRVATRRNDRDLRVANRDVWAVAGIGDDGSLIVVGRAGQRTLPKDYVSDHVELAFASTAYGAQGQTVDSAHLVVGEHTGAAAAYVAMTRGRHHNVAHLVADTVDEARRQWIEVFNRDRADLGPGHAATRVDEDIDRYGTRLPDESWTPPPRPLGRDRSEVRPTSGAQQRVRGVGR
ncbi:MAG: relaxase domain-containing protein [Nocardioides sp.]|uniref:MobF family relaxase n=1 Tax=Nocardioides sp. TaxID=35761 RepID=UPI0023A3F994|nr:MobF family relaxase [Nocardioides sp.]MDE0775110.1 relaxase domain-containing protein [Nocardioides sp.]